MAEEISKPPETTTVHGREIILTSGAKVFGARHKKSAIWRFTSVEGAVTRVTLSTEAMSAMVQLYQGMLGCDEDFAAVGFYPLPDSTTNISTVATTVSLETPLDKDSPEEADIASGRTVNEGER